MRWSLERNGDDGAVGGRPAGAGGLVGMPSRAGTASGGAPTGGTCACDPIACSPGYETVPKGCCYECVIDVQACAEQRGIYAQLRQETIQNQSANGCMTAADCGIFEDRTQCAPTCAFVIPNSARRGIDDRLYRQADEICNPDCPPAPAPPCMPLPAPQYLAGRCQ